MSATLKHKNIPIIYKSKPYLIYTLAIAGVIILSISQDYIYSKLRHTGFYLSESIAYNTFWIFFMPLGFLSIQIYQFYHPKNNVFKVIYSLGLSLAYSILHIVLFTSLFILISNICFNPPHRFSSIFKSVLSNHFYIAFIFYAVGPYIYKRYLKRDIHDADHKTEYADTINLNIGSSIKPIKVSTIQVITTDKPYLAIHTDADKFLVDKRLKEFETELDGTMFLRVHRSTLINNNYISEMASRKNGDYDVVMKNGMSVRFSRHFRKNWNSLLH